MMNSRTLALLCAAAALLLTAVSAPTEPGKIQVLTLSGAKAFRMGDATSVRIVSPETGAARLTLNYSVSEPGNEFPQHVHDGSDDMFLVLQGQVDVRQGDSRRLLRAGQAAFVPAGQIHGTVTTGTGTAVLISFQCPPDPALYTGARDSSRPGAPRPQGKITRGAVQLLDFRSHSGFFTYPGMGSKRVAAAYRKLRSGESFAARAAVGAEELLFVLSGTARIKSGNAVYRAGEKDAVFAAGPVSLIVENAAASETEIVQVESPPGPESGLR
jgi:quercetin dioxygenase-like cupin family protein